MASLELSGLIQSPSAGAMSSAKRRKRRSKPSASAAADAPDTGAAAAAASPAAGAGAGAAGAVDAWGTPGRAGGSDEFVSVPVAYTAAQVQALECDDATVRAAAQEEAELRAFLETMARGFARLKAANDERFNAHKADVQAIMDRWCCGTRCCG